MGGTAGFDTFKNRVYNEQDESPDGGGDQLSQTSTAKT